MNTNIIRPREAHEHKVIPNGEPQILSEGKIGAIVGFPVLVDQGEGYVEKMFEKFVRPPGTRIIAVKDGKIYLQKEYRSETETFDWRLPGGKVIDTFKEYKACLGKEMPEEMILTAGKRELLEEAQLKAENAEIFKKSSCGASVEWDMYYIVATGITEDIHEHNEGEEIVEGKWCDFETVLEMCKSGEIGEDRTISILFQYIESTK